MLLLFVISYSTKITCLQSIYMKKTLLLITCCYLQTLFVLSQTPIVHWRLNGNTTNETGASFTGTLHRNPTPTTNRFGTANAAFEFTRTNNLIRFGDILDTLFCKPNSQFSITGWAKTTSLPLYTGGNMIVTKSLGASGPYQWHINHDKDGKVKGTISFTASASEYIEKASTSPISTGTWFHFALIFDGTAADTNKIRFYVNGSPGAVLRKVGSNFPSSTTNTAQELTIGGSFTPGLHLDSVGNGYDGSIDDIRIYNMALSTIDVQNDLSSSVLEPDKILNNIIIYPNPTTGKIRFDNTKQLTMQIHVMNLIGQTLYETTVDKDNSLVELPSYISQGTYIIQCFTTNTKELIAIKKLIVE